MQRLFRLEMCYLCNTTGDKTLNSELLGHDSTLVSSSPIFFSKDRNILLSRLIFSAFLVLLCLELTSHLQFLRVIDRDFMTILSLGRG